MNTLVTLLFHDLYTRDPEESGFSGPGANRYKMSLPDFDSQLRSILRERDDKPVLLTGEQGADHPDGAFAITVDDGGLSYYSLLADRIEAHGWRGHCLVTTGYIGRQGFLEPHHLRELHERGHIIGSHSVTHPPQISRCSWQQLVDEWRKSKQTLEDLLGCRVQVGSIPGGYYSKRVALAAREAGLDVLFTSEPERTPRLVHGCRLVGRYALRRDSRSDHAGRLVGQRSATLAREWLVWNTKKVIKSSIGSGYVQVTNLMDRS